MSESDDVLSAPNRARLDWTSSPALQQRFASADDYARHRAEEARRSEGAGTGMSEAQRRAEIDAMALPGHEALIVALKADPTMTIGQAALRIVAAEKLRHSRGK